MRFNILNSQGHTAVAYEPTPEHLAAAEREFHRLTREEGRAAFALLPGGDTTEPEHVTRLPADAEEVTFISPLQGG